MLNVAVRAARQAGRLINRASVDIETVQITRKDRNDFVTEVDRASEAAIIETLLAAYPDHAILAEESGFKPGRSTPADTPLKDVEHVWIIDPLDGTTNFIHGLPHYCISIALMERGVITQALIFDPNRTSCSRPPVAGAPSSTTAASAPASASAWKIRCWARASPSVATRTRTPT